MTNGDEETLTWVAKLPLWHHRQLWQQLALALGLPLLVLLGLMTVLEWPPSATMLRMLGRIVLVVGGILLFLVALGTYVVYAGGYWLEYELDAQGISSHPYGKTARKNNWINRSLIVLGSLTGRPGAVGAGLLAQGHQREYVAWHRVTRARTNSKHHIIYLYGKRLLMVIGCEAADYERVLQCVKNRVGVS